jgi:hypothetical protein
MMEQDLGSDNADTLVKGSMCAELGSYTSYWYIEVGLQVFRYSLLCIIALIFSIVLFVT